MKEIRVKDYTGTDVRPEDAILLKKILRENLPQDVTLDFEGIKRIPSSFYSNLLVDIMGTENRNFVANHLKVKNLKNENDFKRVLYGTNFH
jgi:hypothetical protein